MSTRHSAYGHLGTTRTILLRLSFGSGTVARNQDMWHARSDALSRYRDGVGDGPFCAAARGGVRGAISFAPHDGTIGSLRRLGGFRLASTIRTTHAQVPQHEKKDRDGDDCAL